jgi:hypothetical protein
VVVRFGGAREDSDLLCERPGAMGAAGASVGPFVVVTKAGVE